MCKEVEEVLYKFEEVLKVYEKVEEDFEISKFEVVEVGIEVV